MNLLIASDTHFEFHRDGGGAFVAGLDPTGVDVLVLAGDVAVCALLEGALARLAERFPRVVFVPGNHEYYAASPRSVAAVRRSIEVRLPNVSWLEESVVEIAGVRFVGSTLWFPDGEEQRRNRHRLADFKYIQGFEPWVYERHRAAVRFLDREVREGDVVITHHLPHRKSVAARHDGSPIGCYFLADVGPLVEDRGAALWAHGHTHDACDYVAGRTRVVCNPLGYPREPHCSFNERCIVQIGEVV